MLKATWRRGDLPASQIFAATRNDTTYLSVHRVDSRGSYWVSFFTPDGDITIDNHAPSMVAGKRAAETWLANYLASLESLVRGLQG
jgi:hypothetical protein